MSDLNQGFTSEEVNPLHSLDEWEDDVLKRYPHPESKATSKSTKAYRNYEAPARDSVKEFYRLNHTDKNRAMEKWVNLFNPYDLYSKNPTPPVWSELKPYYEKLVAKYLPDTIKF